MVDPFTIIIVLRAIGSCALGISNLLGQAHENKEECHRLRKHIGTVIAVAEDLRRQLKAANIEVDVNSPVSVTFKGLQEALDSSLRTVEGCVKKTGLYGALKADGIAKKLRAVDDEITKKLLAAVAATTACHISVSAKINESVDALRAEMKAGHDALRDDMKHIKDRVDAIYDAMNNNTRGRDAASSSNSSVLAKHSKHVPNNALPGVHLPREATSSVSSNSKLVVGKVPSSSVVVSAGPSYTSSLRRRTMEPGETSSIREYRSSEKGSISKNNVLADHRAASPASSLLDGLASKSASSRTMARQGGSIANKANSSLSSKFAVGQVPSSSVAGSAGPSYTSGLRQPGETSSKQNVSFRKTNALTDRSASHASSSFDGSASKCSSMRSPVPRQGGPISIVKKIISRIQTKTGTMLIPIDVHPKKTWVVMTTEEVGRCVIWDYEKEVTELQVKMKQQVCSAKFIVPKEWLAVGTGDGSIYIYSYTGTDELREVDSFKAYAGCCEEEIKAYVNKAIHSMAVSVHPREPRLLLAFGCTIMQWRYLRDGHTWKRNRKIQVRSPVRSLKYNPRDGGDTFVIVTSDNEAKIYTTDFSSDPAITLEGTSSADYYPTNNNQHWVITCQNASSISEIQDFKTRKVARTLEVSGLQMVRVACHPTHQILATSTIPKDKGKMNTKDRGTGSTTSEDRIIYLWDANTHRIEKMVQIPGMGSRHSMEFATDDRNGLTRLFVKFETKIAIVEVNLPVANTSQRTRHEYGRAT